MRCDRASATTPSIARAHARRGCADGFPTAVPGEMDEMGEICGWTVDSERVRVWMNVWTRSWTKDLVGTQARADDSQRRGAEGQSQSGGGAERGARLRAHSHVL